MASFLYISAALAGVVALSTSVAASTAASTERDNDEQQVLCKQQIKTGTRFAKKTCMSKEKWEMAAEQAKRQAAEEFSRPRISTEKGN